MLREGDTVILESTVPPGTTEERVRPVLEESGLEAGTDFGLAHCPETVLPGNILAELRENDRIVGGIGPESTEPAVVGSSAVRIAPSTKESYSSTAGSVDSGPIPPTIRSFSRSSARMFPGRTVSGQCASPKSVPASSPDSS
ncbi:hypothetical protein DJ73_08580, partial [Halorubrum sp. Ea1]